MSHDLHSEHVAMGELQYKGIYPRMLVEQQLNLDEVMDVTHWYVANGRPVLAIMDCPSKVQHDTNRQRTARAADFSDLPGVETHLKACDGSDIPKPKAWDLMRKVAEEMAPHLASQGVARVDLYASDTQVFFSGTWRKIQRILLLVKFPG